VMENKRFQPTELGIIVDTLLKENFPRVVDPNFTATMEEKLDKIEEGDVDWVVTVRDFYTPFSAELATAEKSIERVKIDDEVSDVK
ncbi:MAG TPA: DNA topoisomerase I, partial [Firmicutes bacterium]|nr:DNA topoisomerase I [Bacillota bacterium]